MDEWDRLRNELAAAGVTGADDLGKFVNNTDYFEPSRFDEKAAMPVLLAAFPWVSEPLLVAAIARHLRRPWARPKAFAALLDAFVRWGPDSGDTGWALGDSLATVATDKQLDELLVVVVDQSFGTSRQMIVDALWRFRKDNRVAATLLGLVNDPQVALHPMSALRRTLRNEAALPHLRTVRDHHPDSKVRQLASLQVKRAEKAAARYGR